MSLLNGLKTAALSYEFSTVKPKSKRSGKRARTQHHHPRAREGNGEGRGQSISTEVKSHGSAPKDG